MRLEHREYDGSLILTLSVETLKTQFSALMKIARLSIQLFLLTLITRSCLNCWTSVLRKLRRRGVLESLMSSLTMIVVRWRRKCSVARGATNSDAQGPPGAIRAIWLTAQNNYRKTVRQKKSPFWHDRINSERGNPRQLWRSLKTICGDERNNAETRFKANYFAKLFKGKVKKIRASTATALPPPIT